MADIRGFLKHSRQTPTRRPVPVRLLDWNEVYEDFDQADLKDQASRMPFLLVLGKTKELHCMIH